MKGGNTNELPCYSIREGFIGLAMSKHVQNSGSVQPGAADPFGNTGEGESIYLVSSVNPLSLATISFVPFRGDENKLTCEQIREVKKKKKKSLRFVNIIKPKLHLSKGHNKIL